MKQSLKWPDLSPRAAAALEWWFVQGHFEADNLGRRHFMLSLFRHARKSGGDTHMALLSTLDPETGRHHVRSQVSPEFVDNLIREAPGQLQKWGVEDRLAEAFVKELEESGPPEPILSEPAPAELTSSPFKAAWGDLTLHQSGDGITLGF